MGSIYSDPTFEMIQDACLVGQNRILMIQAGLKLALLTEKDSSLIAPNPTTLPCSGTNPKMRKDTLGTGYLNTGWIPHPASTRKYVQSSGLFFNPCLYVSEQFAFYPKYLPG